MQDTLEITPFHWPDGVRALDTRRIILSVIRYSRRDTCECFWEWYRWNLRGKDHCDKPSCNGRRSWAEKKLIQTEKKQKTKHQTWIRTKDRKEKGLTWIKYLTCHICNTLIFFILYVTYFLCLQRGYSRSDLKRWDWRTMSVLKLQLSVAAPQFCIRKHWTCQASGKTGFEAAFYITPDDLSEHERRSSAIIHGIMLKPPCVLLRLLSRHLGAELRFPASQWWTNHHITAP